MKVLVLLLATLVLAQAAQVPKYRDLSKYKPKKRLVDPRPGSKPALSWEGRIVGGWEATPHQYPWQVAVFIDDLYFCGGSLISDKAVLTAAHCCEDAVFFNLMFGAHNVRETVEDGRVELESRVYDIHPGWDTFNLHNDVCVIHLPEALELNDIIKPVALESRNSTDLHVGEIEIVSGWGRPSDASSSISPVLRNTNVTIITNVECRSYYDIVLDNMICIGTNAPATSGHGTCNGDSGGPMVHVNNDGSVYQIGVVSFGSSTGCETGYPDGFSRVSSFEHWISVIAGIAK